MNRKQLIVLLAIGILVGGVGLFLSKRESASWKSGDATLGQKVLPDFPLNEVAHVTIKEPASELNLVKSDDRWRVKERWDYPANYSEISELLRKMWELKTVRGVKVGPSDLWRLELLTPDKGTNSGTLVEFKDKSGKTVQSLLLGKKDMRDSGSSSPYGGGAYPTGRYVMIPGGQPSVSLISDPLTDVEAKADRWVSKDFFKVEKLRSVSVQSTNEANSWTVARETEGGELKLLDKSEGEQFDASKASSVGWALSSPSFNDVVAPDASAEETGLDKPLVATLETFDHFVYTVKIGSTTAEDNYHVQVAVDADIPKERTPAADEKPEDKEKLDKEFQEKVKKLEEKLQQENEIEKWTYLVSKWTIDPLLKQRSEFMADKKEETPPAAESGSEPSSNAEPSAPDLLKLDGLTPPLPIKPN